MATASSEENEVSKLLRYLRSFADQFAFSWLPRLPDGFHGMALGFSTEELIGVLGKASNRTQRKDADYEHLATVFSHMREATSVFWRTQDGDGQFVFHPISRDEALTLVKSGAVITLRSDLKRLTYSEIFALPATVEIVRREPGMLVATTDTICKLTAAEADQVKGMDRKEKLGFLRAKHNEQGNAVNAVLWRRTGRNRS